MNVSRSKRIGAWLILLTILLVLVGCILYVIGYQGWGQLLWVMASGTAGGGIVLFVEKE
jgi:hypothetical protein